MDRMLFAGFSKELDCGRRRLVPHLPHLVLTILILAILALFVVTISILCLRKAARILFSPRHLFGSPAMIQDACQGMTKLCYVWFATQGEKP
jgi:hypothetical protein